MMLLWWSCIKWAPPLNPHPTSASSPQPWFTPKHNNKSPYNMYVQPIPPTTSPHHLPQPIPPTTSPHHLPSSTHTSCKANPVRRRNSPHNSPDNSPFQSQVQNIDATAATTAPHNSPPPPTPLAKQGPPTTAPHLRSKASHSPSPDNALHMW